jgi:hypothetical protein
MKLTGVPPMLVAAAFAAAPPKSIIRLPCISYGE